MNKISNHITYLEATYSFTAYKRGIDNIPNSQQLSNLKLLAEMVFEPLRSFVGGPIKVNSMFRCLELNNALGGSKTSSHLKGEAMDLDDTFGNKTNKEMGDYIREELDFDQLIYEFLDDSGQPKWIHVSYKESGNRNEVLIAWKDANGKTVYLPYDDHKYLLS